MWPPWPPAIPRRNIPISAWARLPKANTKARKPKAFTPEPLPPIRITPWRRSAWRRWAAPRSRARHDHAALSPRSNCSGGRCRCGCAASGCSQKALRRNLRPLRQPPSRPADYSDRDEPGLRPALDNPGGQEVQLGAWRQEAEAAAGWNHAVKAAGGALSGFSPRIVTRRSAGKGALLPPSGDRRRMENPCAPHSRPRGLDCLPGQRLTRRTGSRPP